MNCYNIVDIATALQSGIIEYQTNNPDCKSQEKAEIYAIGKVMKMGRGKFNPQTLRLMLAMEQSVYRKDTNLRC